MYTGALSAADLGESVLGVFAQEAVVQADPRCSRWQLMRAYVLPGGQVGGEWMRIDFFPSSVSLSMGKEHIVELLLEEDRRFPYNSWAARREHFRRATSGLRDELRIRFDFFVDRCLRR